jgi:type VI secretion system secreted protein Hcp
MKIKGAKQGQFKGDVTKDDKGIEKDAVGIYSFEYGIESPRDSATGMPSGKRQHHPVTIVKRAGPSTINLMTAISSNEVITTATLHFYRPDGSGKLAKFLGVELTNASILSYNLNSSEETESSGGTTERSGGQIAGAGHTQLTTEARLERVSFVFQKIEVTWTDGGLTIRTTGRRLPRRVWFGIFSAIA